jgi:ABC-type uncharacterized transport system involved in gliding motility auxiliary subunit
MKRLGSIAALALVLAAFFAVNILAAAAMRPVRVDLTQDKLYTLSEGSRKIARGLPGPVKLTLYFSTAASDGIPQIKSYAARVRELLEGYARESGGKITLEVVDPEPFTEAEDRAVGAGLAAMPTGGAGAPTLYFGLVATNDTDGQKIIPFFDPGGEQFLEYEVSRVIYALSNPAKHTIGVISMLPLEGGMEMDPRSGQPMPGRPWQLLGLLREFFEVTMLGPDITEVPAGTDALLVIHPKNIPAGVRYAIDQFVLGGGRAMVFVDPYCEADTPPGGFQDQMQMLMAPRASDMPDLFAAWGVKLAQEQLAGDLDRGMSVMVARGAEPVTYVAWLGLEKDDLDPGDAVTGQLGAITMGVAGILQKADGATTQFTPLISTSEQSMALGLEKIRFRPDPKELLAGFVSGNTNLTLAARITGPAKTAFPGGRPAPEPGPDGSIAEPPGEPAAPLTESKGDINVIVVADADMLTDRFWIEEQTVGPISLGFRKTADNGDFVVQALDNLSGSSDLISMRARGRFSRPFSLVEKIQKNAEVQYQAEQSALQARLQETESRLSELQRQRPEGEEAGGGGVILSPEQQAELERFRKEMVDTRKELRAVQANMRKDIEALGTKLKWANIGLVPAAVTLAAISMGVYRAGRRSRKDSTTEAQRTQRENKTERSP